tara:strand:- start:335 stop:508 length:174 start_codon:yes stop_codon:yes gene_type:complete
MGCTSIEKPWQPFRYFVSLGIQLRSNIERILHNRLLDRLFNLDVSGYKAKVKVNGFN